MPISNEQLLEKVRDGANRIQWAKSFLIINMLHDIFDTHFFSTWHSTHLLSIFLKTFREGINAIVSGKKNMELCDHYYQILRTEKGEFSYLTDYSTNEFCHKFHKHPLQGKTAMTTEAVERIFGCAYEMYLIHRATPCISKENSIFFHAINMDRISNRIRYASAHTFNSFVSTSEDFETFTCGTERNTRIVFITPENPCPLAGYSVYPNETEHLLPPHKAILIFKGLMHRAEIARRYYPNKSEAFADVENFITVYEAYPAPNNTARQMEKNNDVFVKQLVSLFGHQVLSTSIVKSCLTQANVIIDEKDALVRNEQIPEQNDIASAVRRLSMIADQDIFTIVWQYYTTDNTAEINTLATSLIEAKYSLVGQHFTIEDHACAVMRDMLSNIKAKNTNSHAPKAGVNQQIEYLQTTMHGPIHACRVALLIPKLIAIYTESGNEETKEMLDEHILSLQLAAMFHDYNYSILGAQTVNSGQLFEHICLEAGKRYVHKFPSFCNELGDIDDLVGLAMDTVFGIYNHNDEQEIFTILLHDANCIDELCMSGDTNSNNLYFNKQYPEQMARIDELITKHTLLLQRLNNLHITDDNITSNDMSQKESEMEANAHYYKQIAKHYKEIEPLNIIRPHGSFFTENMALKKQPYTLLNNTGADLNNQHRVN